MLPWSSTTCLPQSSRGHKDAQAAQGRTSRSGVGQNDAPCPHGIPLNGNHIQHPVRRVGPRLHPDDTLNALEVLHQLCGALPSLSKENGTASAQQECEHGAMEGGMSQGGLQCAGVDMRISMGERGPGEAWRQACA